MCIDVKSVQKYQELMARSSKQLTEEEYEFLKHLGYPVDGMGYRIKENASSSV